MIRGVGVLAAQTLRVRRNSLLAWSLSFASLVVVYVAMFPSVAKVNFDEIIKQYPKELLRAFGFDNAVTQLSTAIGFLNTELFGFMLPLAVIFLPIGVIVHMVPKAEERGYLDSLLSAPIARWQLIAGAALAATLALLVPLLAMIAVGLITAQLAGVHLTLSQIGASSLSLLPMGALAGSIATLVVGATRRHGVATAVAGGVIVVMYLMNVLAGFLSFFDDVKSLSIFHYYGQWINTGIDWPAYVAFLAIAAVLTVAGAALFERRDIGA